MDIREWLGQVSDWLLTGGLRLFAILIITFVALKLARVLSRRIFTAIAAGVRTEESQKRADTLASVVHNLLRTVILIVALIMVLGELGIEIGPILAAAGIVGLAVGFGAQNMVKDVISGFFILMEDQIRVGDVVQVSGKGGVVEEVRLRTTVLRDLAGNVHYVPNGQIDVVTNMTKGFSYYVFDIGVAYREDVDEVTAVMQEVGEQLRRDPPFSEDILEPLEILGLDRFDDSAVIIKARIKTRPIKQWTVGREYNRRLKKAFDERGIEIPFPHVTVYMGEDKQGQAPPVRIVQVPAS